MGVDGPKAGSDFKPRLKLSSCRIPPACCAGSLTPGFSSPLLWALGSPTSGSRSGLTIPTANQPHQLHPASPGPCAGGMDLSGQTQAGPGARGGTHREDGGGETLVAGSGALGRWFCQDSLSRRHGRGRWWGRWTAAPIWTPLNTD